MRVLVCGDRHWFKKSYIREVLSWFDPKRDILIHGNADGADKMSGEVAKSLGWPEERILVFPAEWEKFGRSAGPIRNRQMLEEGKPDIIFAFHSNIESSKGTKDMVQVSCKKGFPVLLYG